MLTLLFSKLILTGYTWANFVLLTRFQEYVHKMYCWFWGIKTSRGKGDIHRNAQRVHVMSCILLLNRSYSGKTNVITAEKISVLTRSFGVLFQLRGGRDVRNSFWWQRRTQLIVCVLRVFELHIMRLIASFQLLGGKWSLDTFWYALLQPSAGRKMRRTIQVWDDTLLIYQSFTVRRLKFRRLFRSLESFGGEI